MNKWLDCILTVLAICALIVLVTRCYHTHPGIDLENHPPAPAGHQRNSHGRGTV